MLYCRWMLTECSTNSDFPYCLELTLAGDAPGKTFAGNFTTYICEGGEYQLSTPVPMSVEGWLASDIISPTTTTSSSIESSSSLPTHYVHTDATQRSVSAIVPSRATGVGPTATSGVCRSVTVSVQFRLILLPLLFGAMVI